MHTPSWILQHLAAVRALVVLTLVVGLAYPLALTGLARLPGLSGRAAGSLVERDGTVVGSGLVGQAFTDADGAPLPQYVQSRPSAAGDGYDPLATAASNLGPESVVDTADAPSLLSQICARSLAVGELEGVDGSRPYCTPDGVGAVLGVYHQDGRTGPVTRVVSLNQPCPAAPFVPSWDGVTVECARHGEDHAAAVVVPVRGDAPADPVVPPDAVTASGSGLDPHISPAYARLQVPRIARERGADPAAVQRLVDGHVTGRALGFLGEPAVDVLGLNLDLDRLFPVPGRG